MNNERVRVNAECPHCGRCQYRYANPAWCSIRCKGCDLPLFLQYATGTEGEMDEDGFYFHAKELFRHDSKVKALYEVFDDEY